MKVNIPKSFGVFVVIALLIGITGGVVAKNKHTHVKEPLTAKEKFFVDLVSQMKSEQTNSPVKKEYIGNWLVKVTFDGHEYLSYNSTAIIHAESCPCKKQK